MEFIASQERCDELLDSLLSESESTCYYMDLEADNFHHYHEVLCTVQLSANGRYYLLDALALDLKGSFSTLLEQGTVWMHGSDYDQYLFNEFVGHPAQRLHDTQIAAQLCGFTRFGYGALVHQISGVVLPKDSQRADWTIRPLGAKMMEYAQNDVRYLPQIADILTSKLDELGRWDWFVESCARLTQSAVQKKRSSPKDPWRLNGSGNMSRRELRDLKALWEWRDTLARTSDKPAFKISSNQQLLDWVKDLSEGRSIEPPKKMRSSRREALFATLEKASQQAEEEWPQRSVKERRPKVKLDEDALDALLKVREQVSSAHGLSPGVVVSRKLLEAMVRDPSQVSALMNWQRELMQL